MVPPGDDEQARADLTPAERLEWQSELDSAMADLDTRLRHPRRRASDVAAQPTLPQLGQFNVTNELLDEIAWRVAEQMRRAQDGVAPAAPVAPVAPAAPLAPLAPLAAAAPAVLIRLRRPLFSWRFWRRRTRRSQALITFSDYRVN